MSTSYQSDYARAMQRKVIWDKTRCKAAGLLALGYPKQYVADEIGVHRNTILNWMDDVDFAEEVDRLTLMTGLANRSERIRLAMRVVRSKLDEAGVPITAKDVLDWIKYAQSETDGAKLDMSKLIELLSGSTGDSEPIPEPLQLAPPADTDHNPLRLDQSSIDVDQAATTVTADSCDQSQPT